MSLQQVKDYSVFVGDELIFEPSDKQLLFLQSIKPYILYGGARGGGKTAALIWKCIFTCTRIPGCNVIFLRKSMPELKANALTQFDRIPYIVYADDPSAYNLTDKVITFRNGSKLWFKGCQNVDDVRNMFKGGEYVLICVDEFTEWTFEQFEEMKGASRCPIKTDINGDPVICQIVAGTNPGGPGHAFVKALWIDRKQIPGQDPQYYDPTDYEFIKALVYDNVVYSKDKAYLKTLESMSPARRAAYLEGSWDVFDGQYYDNFDTNATYIDNELVLREMKKQPWQPKWISIDWGFAHFAVILWHTTLMIDGQVSHITYREHVVSGLGEAALGQELVRLNQEEQIKHIFLSPDCFGDTINSRAALIGNVLAVNNLPRPIPANNERVDGWRLIYDMLNDRPFSKARVSSACPKLIESIPVVIRDSPTKPEDVKKINQQEDDIMDCYRYGLMSYLNPKKKPENLEIQEKLLAIDDPTRRNIVWLQLKNKNKRKGPLRSR